jgi:hypothetical protein
VQRHRLTQKKVRGKIVSQLPVLRDCAELAQLPVDLVKTTDFNVLDLRLGKSIYGKEQMEDFARFQDSQNTRRAYLAETAKVEYLGRSGRTWVVAGENGGSASRTSPGTRS